MLDHKKYLCSPFQCSLNTDSEESRPTVNIFGSSVDESGSVQWKDYYLVGEAARQINTHPNVSFPFS